MMRKDHDDNRSTGLEVKILKKSFIIEASVYQHEEEKKNEKK
jgi:uncharacterized membrane protein affecting hemolysin expression